MSENSTINFHNSQRNTNDIALELTKNAWTYSKNGNEEELERLFKKFHEVAR
jgi:hypothetical protein